MKMKKEWIILAAVILVLALYLIFRNQDQVQYQVPKLPEIVKKDISKIEITKKEGVLLLNKKDNEWHISPQGYLLDKSNMDSILEIIGDLTMDSLVSESKNYFQYDLVEDKKISVKAWNGETPVREFDIGKIGPSFQHTFVKLKDDPRVFLARQAFRSRFDQTVDNLRDKTVLALEKTEIQGIDIHTSGKSITLMKNEVPRETTDEKKTDAPEKEPPAFDVVWKTGTGEEKEKAKIDRIISDYANLKCDSYMEGKQKEDLIDPIYTIRLTGIKDYSLSIFAKTESEANNYPAVSSENDYPFFLPEWRVKDIQKKADELMGIITGPGEK
ncbi:MAG: DUF4340 domain-containing protein [Deltaproteobacteria bacterium]|nr:DUF4340 domain-containing protein [Deltaproteobacteria bacterium]